MSKEKQESSFQIQEMQEVQNISVTLPASIHLEPEAVQEAVMAFFYHQGLISEHQACEILGMTRREFEEVLPKFGFSILPDDQQTLETEFNA